MVAISKKPLIKENVKRAWCIQTIIQTKGEAVEGYRPFLQQTLHLIRKHLELHFINAGVVVLLINR